MVRTAFCRGVWKRATVLAAMGALALATFTASAASKAQRRYRGKILFQSEPFESFATEEAFDKAMRKAAKNTTLVQDKDGNWSFHFIAFLKQRASAPKINLVWYRMGKKRDQLDYTEFVVQPGESLFQGHATLTTSPGFKVGDRLEARVTRLIGGREVVYARCRLTLR